MTAKEEAKELVEKFEHRKAKLFALKGIMEEEEIQLTTIVKILDKLDELEKLK